MTREVEELNSLMVGIYTDIVKAESTAMQRGPFPDLSVTEAHTLVEIGRDEAKTMGEIAAGLGITVPTLTVSIARLCKKGYVERQRDEADRRLVRVRLTQRGLRAERIHLYFHRLLVGATISNLKKDEIAALKKALLNLDGFFHEYLAQQ